MKIKINLFPRVLCIHLCIHILNRLILGDIAQREIEVVGEIFFIYVFLSDTVREAKLRQIVLFIYICIVIKYMGRNVHFHKHER